MPTLTTWPSLGSHELLLIHHVIPHLSLQGLRKSCLPNTKLLQQPDQEQYPSMRCHLSNLREGRGSVFMRFPRNGKKERTLRDGNQNRTQIEFGPLLIFFKCIAVLSMIKSIFLSEAIKLSVVIKDHCHLKSRLMRYRLRSFLSLETSINNSVASTPPPSISKAKIQISVTEVPGSLCVSPI